MSDKKLPVLHVTLLNGSEKEAKDAIDRVKVAVGEEFFLVGSTKPFLFKSQEDLAMALETILKILRGQPLDTNENTEEKETNDK